MLLNAVMIFAFMHLGISGYAKDRNTLIIDSLNMAAKNAYNYDFGYAASLASIAKEKALKYNYSKGKIASTCILSMVGANTNHCTAAIDSLNVLLSNKRNYDTQSLQLLYTTLGICCYYKGAYESARKAYESGLMLFNISDRSLPYAKICLLAAKVYSKKGMFTRALTYYNLSREVLRQNRDPETIGWSNDVLGDIYYGQRLYQQAVAAISQSFTDFKAAQNRNGMISSLIQLGNTYYMLMKDDSATACYTEALQTAKALGDSMSIAINYSNLSRIFLDHQNSNKSIEYAEKALKAIAPGNYISIEAGTYQQLGDIYGELGNYAKAIQYIEKALSTARSSDNKTIIQDCYKSLSEVYKAMNKTGNAYDYLLAAYHIKDSVQSVAFGSQLADMQVKYETEKKETQIRLLHQQQQITHLKMLEQQHKLKIQQLLMLILVAMIIAIIAAIYFYISSRRQAEQSARMEAIRRAEETERSRIAKDIHDELGSGLSKINVLSEILNRHPNDKQSQITLHSIAATSRHLIDNMRDMVWNMNPENTTLDNLIARIWEYSTEYLEDLPVEIITDIPENVPSGKISMEVSRNVYMILKESLQNIVKHAQASVVQITIKLHPHFRMEIMDNGKGYDLNKKNEGNGLKNIIARANTIGANLNITSEPGRGTKITLELDILQ